MITILQIFKELHPAYQRKDFIIRGPKVNIAFNTDVSINRCPHRRQQYHPFLPEITRMCPASVGKQNICSVNVNGNGCSAYMFEADPHQRSAFPSFPEVQPRGQKRKGDDDDDDDRPGPSGGRLSAGLFGVCRTPIQRQQIPIPHLTPLKKMLLLRAIDVSQEYLGEADQPKRISRKVMDVVMLLTGMGKTTIYNVFNENDQDSRDFNQVVGARFQGHGRPKIPIDSYTQQTLRLRIQRMYGDKDSPFPTITRVYDSLVPDMERGEIPSMGRVTMWQAVKAIGFFYGKRNDKQFLCEQNDIRATRAKYLRAITRARLAGRPIFWQDETWV